MNDIYMHLDSNVMYIEESIPGPPESSKEYEDFLNAFNSQLTRYCTCLEICTKDCPCIKNTGGPNYVGNDDSKNLRFRLDYELKDFKTHSIIECNKLCKCSVTCGNRVVQHGPVEGLVIQACEPKGLGLFTNKFICRGTFICEYAGEIITKHEALRRHNKNKVEGKMNYIYCLNEHVKDKVIQTFVDPSDFGNIGRYLNHACSPNCSVIPVRVNSPIPKLAIFSQTDIGANTELTFNYGSAYLENDETVPMKGDTGDRKECSCDSVDCTGWMPFDNY